MIELILARHDYTSKCTLGALYKDSRYLCNILEDAIRKVKVYGQTAIPMGRYRVDFTFSGRFGRQLPLLLDTPFFSGVRLHPGNSSEDTDGCLLPGFDYVRNGQTINVYRSREAMEKLILPIFQNQQEEVWLTILGGYSAEEMTTTKEAL